MRRSEPTRWAVPRDAAAIAEVHVTSWQETYRGILDDEFLDSLDLERRAAWWDRFLRDGARVHVIDDGGVVGFCHAAASDDDAWGEVFAIYLLPEKWGTGMGAELLAVGEASMRAEGFDRALLWVLEANARARHFYERQGWVVGKPIRVEEIGGTQVTEVRYEKDL